LLVVELVGAVIDWHVRDLVPDTSGLAADARCELVEADFFAMMRSGRCPSVDVMLVDIDHSPQALLADGHGDFYTIPGLATAAAALSEQGVFALWSDDPPEDGLLGRLRACFTRARAEVVTFDNPITGGTSACTVYVASTPMR
jgi:spermidine synthase